MNDPSAITVAHTDSTTTVLKWSGVPANYRATATKISARGDLVLSSRRSCSIEAVEVGPTSCSVKRLTQGRWKVSVIQAVGAEKIRRTNFISVPQFPYLDAACDDEDPKISAAGLTLPVGVGPEARVAAACMALEWLSNPAPDPAVVKVVQGPTVHPERSLLDVRGLLAMERLVAHRYPKPVAPILLLVAGSDFEWACSWGKKRIDPKIPYPLPWTEQWLGCKSERWACGASNVLLTDGTRFVFSACPKNIIDMTQPAPETLRWNGLRFGHESIQILFQMLTGGDFGIPNGTWGGLIARSAGMYYFERAASWLAGTPRNWRFDNAGSGQYEDVRDAWMLWRASEAGSDPDFDFRQFIVNERSNLTDPTLTLMAATAGFAGEYLVAHYGADALFSWLSGKTTLRETFGVTERVLLRSIGTYVQQQLDSSQ